MLEKEITLTELQLAFQNYFAQFAAYNCELVINPFGSK